MYEIDDDEDLESRKKLGVGSPLLNVIDTHDLMVVV